MYIQFASLAQQHNLTLCQVNDQVCGDTFTVAQTLTSKELQYMGETWGHNMILNL